MNTRTKIFVVVLILAVIAYFIYRRKKAAAEAINQNFIPVNNVPVQASGVSIETPPTDSYPLQVGSSGPNVKRLQTALNRISPTNKITEDGNFGNQTKSKLILSVATSLYGVGGTVSEAQLNKLILLGNNQ